MLIIGCDYHPSGQQVFGIDAESGEVFADRWIAHTGRELEEFYGGLPAGTVVGVECSGNMLWFERRLAQYGHRLRLGDAAKIRSKETRKQKHDRRDAELIARLLREDQFPDLQWVPTLAERDQRQLLLHRHKLVRMRAQVKNQLQHIALNQGQQKKRQLWTKAGRELLEHAAGALDGAAAGRSAALAGSAQPRLRQSGAGGRAGGGGGSRGAAADDASRDWAGDQSGICADHWFHRTLPAQPGTGELSGIESDGRFQWRAAAAGRDQQTGQQFYAPVADSGSADRGSWR
jgi:hypothetical protein